MCLIDNLGQQLYYCLFFIMWHKIGENELTLTNKTCNANPLSKKT